LVRTALREGRISLIEFYVRRARRLLPAATTVLAATLLGTFVFLPQARWQETATQIAASALYVQNWMLAWLSVDYLAAENAASPVQHYWSLSVEEQFYVLWPLMMIAAHRLARRYDVPLRRALAPALAFVFIGSLAASMIVTAREPVQAYFMTHTRIWELALGGLLALTIVKIDLRSHHMRSVMSVVGFAAIFWSSLFYSPLTEFPGAAALIPTLGAVLIIVAGDVRLGFLRGLGSTWLRYVGDRSYSIYLWHWPLIVFSSGVEEGVGLADGIGLIVLTMVLSHSTYKFIEQRYRHPRSERELRPLGYSLVSVAVCVGAAFAIQHFTAPQVAVRSETGASYPGSAALLASEPVPKGVVPIPPLTALKRDLPASYSKECHQNQLSAEPISCTLGDKNGSQTIVLVGDSHAAQWLPALERIADSSGWKLITFTKSACAFSNVDLRWKNKPYLSCTEWRENVTAEILRLRPQLFFTSQTRYSYIEREAMAEGLRSSWRRLIDVGVKIVAIRDTPRMPFDPGDCLARRDRSACVARRGEAESDDIFRLVASKLEGVHTVDMTDGICGPETCSAVVGNIIVWRDRHHLTATYAATLAVYLAEQIGLRTPSSPFARAHRAVDQSEPSSSNTTRVPRSAPP
jgi:peptidoglycan/LPS O-acetylase OafA/YrhL